MSAKIMTAEIFLRDVAAHEMTVLLDNGVYRHLKFRNAPPHAWNMWFEIITWPGSLAIHGDVGSWSFSRVEDMFTFFRSEELRINVSYWCEKVQSESRFGGPSRAFNADTFEANVRRALEGYDLPEEKRAEILNALGDEVFGEDHEPSARRYLDEFEYEDFRFSDTWEIRGDGYTYHFLWCLYAIVWAIQQYDRAKEAGGRDAA